MRRFRGHEKAFHRLGKWIREREAAIATGDYTLHCDYYRGGGNHNERLAEKNGSNLFHRIKQALSCNIFAPSSLSASTFYYPSTATNDLSFLSPCPENAPGELAY